MFYSQFILAKKGPLGTIWIAAHLERKLRKNQVADTDIGVSVDSILSPDIPIALRLSSHLLLGVVRIYSRKVGYLFHDCSEALLKIKQAFRSTAVDLPPEESTAPYHSITLPDTFHLDDFELPDSIFQDDFVDHHISTKEQITLQDNPEKTGYSISKFGLDERFGDGNSAHISLDLDEELFADRGKLEKYNIKVDLDSCDYLEHQSAMDIDGAQSGFGKDAESSLSVGPSSYNMDNIGKFGHASSWNGYNIQTPDLNEIFLPRSIDEDLSRACDQPASPDEFVEPAQAPCTPGLVEDTIPDRVRESPLLSPQQKASLSPASTANDEDIKTNPIEHKLENIEPQLAEVEHLLFQNEVCPAAEDVLGSKEGSYTENGKKSSNADVIEKIAVDSLPGDGSDALNEARLTDATTTGNDASVELAVPQPDEVSDVATEPSNHLKTADEQVDAAHVLSAEPEKMLVAPSPVDRSNLLGPPEEGTPAESATSTQTGRKRRAMDDFLSLEKCSTERVSRKPRLKKSDGLIPDDDDILASILVGRSTLGLRVSTSPATARASSLKRPRLLAKHGMSKRKVLMDDVMVLLTDAIRQQLISTEDIRRVRRKAPCTHSEVWMAEKILLEEELFDESMFAGISPEITSLQYRTYNIDRSIHRLSSVNLTQTHEPEDTMNFDPVLGEHGTETSNLMPVTVNPAESDAAVGSSEMQDRPVDANGKAESTLHMSASDHGRSQSEADPNPLYEPIQSHLEPAELESINMSDNWIDQAQAGNAVSATADADVVVEETAPVSEVHKIISHPPIPQFEAAAPGSDRAAMEEWERKATVSSLDPDDTGNGFMTMDTGDLFAAFDDGDTDFLNADEEEGSFVAEATNDDNELNRQGFHSLENTGWSSRTRGIARYLRTLFDEESGQGMKSVAVDQLLGGKTRKEASRMFFETLILRTRDYIEVEQEQPFGHVSIKPGAKLMMSEF